MDDDELIELAKEFLGGAVEFSVHGVTEFPNFYGIELRAGYHVLSYKLPNEHRIGSTQYMAIPRSGKQPFALFEAGE